MLTYRVLTVIIKLFGGVLEGISTEGTIEHPDARPCIRTNIVQSLQRTRKHISVKYEDIEVDRTRNTSLVRILSTCAAMFRVWSCGTFGMLSLRRMQGLLDAFNIVKHTMSSATTCLDLYRSVAERRSHFVKIMHQLNFNCAIASV